MSLVGVWRCKRQKNAIHVDLLKHRTLLSFAGLATRVNASGSFVSRSLFIVRSANYQLGRKHMGRDQNIGQISLQNIELFAFQHSNPSEPLDLSQCLLSETMKIAAGGGAARARYIG
jgi:hypothetical protein